MDDPSVSDSMYSLHKDSEILKPNTFKARKSS